MCFQVELAMTYGCDVDQKRLIQYIHYNRHHNKMLIDALSANAKKLPPPGEEI